MRAYERLLNYVKIHTTSEESNEATPSSDRQFNLGNLLVKELKEMGVKDVSIDDKCYIYAKLPATEGRENAPVLGFIAHMDTAPDYSGENVQPQIIPNYDGRNIQLGQSGLTLSPDNFSHLHDMKGCTLITTDGTTLLGADDKAGVAEIMTMTEDLLSSKLPHGPICIGFTPDEEIGRGADYFDVKRFGADFAYTVDGGAENAIEYENFNAAGAKVVIKGLSLHPGDSKNTMINASLVAMEFNAMLPAGDTPRHTEGYEGFYHLCAMEGDMSEATLSYIVRDHDAALFESRLYTLRHIEKLLNEKYGSGTVTLTIREQYRNMKEMIEPCMHLIDNAKQAVQSVGLQPVTVPIRGGTDGARLSYMGLPCPNLGTGGYGFHGPYEHITAEGMDHVVAILKEIVRLYAES